MYPMIEVHLPKLKHNVESIVNLCKEAGINTIFGVTKVLAGNLEAIDMVIKSGITHIADSRIENLKLFKDYKLPKVLLRLPMQSEVSECVKYADISLNSELETIILLDKEAQKQGKIHQIILMFDLGDLREGLWFENDYFSIVGEILKLRNIKLKGIGTNLTCYGSIIPTKDNLSMLVNIKERIEEKFNIKLEIISGGNSSSLHLIDKKELPVGINSLRIGEAFYLGRETAYEQDLPFCFQDVFTLKAEIIELKTKPSYPVGERGVDAFGQKVEYEDIGLIKRAILAVGKQDVYPSNIWPIDENVKILGSSSDHLIVNVSNTNYKVGDIISFRMGYGGLLQLMTSQYVKKACVYE